MSFYRVNIKVSIWIFVKNKLKSGKPQMLLGKNMKSKLLIKSQSGIKAAMWKNTTPNKYNKLLEKLGQDQNRFEPNLPQAKLDQYRRLGYTYSQIFTEHTFFFEQLQAQYSQMSLIKYSLMSTSTNPSISSAALEQCINNLFLVRNHLHKQLAHQFQINNQLLNQDVISNQNTNKSSSQTGRDNGSSENENGMKAQAAQNFQFPNQAEYSQYSQSPKEQPVKTKISKSDTKNIPKNYLKAIISFIKGSTLTRNIIRENDVNYSDLMINLRRLEAKGNSIQTLKRMWGSQDVSHKVRKCIRILSYIFMRKHSLRYIFNSKVKNYGTHIKYRRKLIQGIESPTKFNNIKDY